MTYSVKEIYYTLQGEGAPHRTARRCSCASRAAICGAGWSADRTDAVCKFCDTDFVGIDGPGGGKFARAEDLARAVAKLWPKGSMAQPYVVCTGGEPLLQLDDALVAALHAEHFEIGIETNGTLDPPAGIEWICVSPKADAGTEAHARQRAQADLSAGGRAARALCGASVRSLLSAADGQSRTRRKPRVLPRTIASPTRNGA